MRIKAVVLAGGGLLPEFRERFDVPSKAFIPLAGKMMVEYILEALRLCGDLEEMVLVTPTEDLPGKLSGMVKAAAPSGENIVSSLKSGIRALGEPPERVLAVPCDLPLLTGEAIKDFLQRCADLRAALYYSYVGRDVSEAAYPRLRHTYVRLREGVFCGGGLVLFDPRTMDKCEKLFKRVTSARKRPWQIAGILGGSIIAKFLLGTLSVRDLEKRVSDLLGFQTRGVLTPYPEVGFNVDHQEELEMAEKILIGRSRC